MELFTDGGRWLKFVQGGPTKWYAQTPLGEYAFGEGQGLYEWRRKNDGTGMERIAYTGGDRQASDKDGSWTVYGRPEPTLLGLEYSIHQYNYGVN